jgi:hypothetical protein
LGTLEIRDVPPPRSEHDCKVQLELLYRSDRDMTFHVLLRGKHNEIYPTRPEPQGLEEYESDQTGM